MISSIMIVTPTPWHPFPVRSVLNNSRPDISVHSLQVYVGVKSAVAPDDDELEVSLENELGYDSFIALFSRSKLMNVYLCFDCNNGKKLPIEKCRREMEVLSHVINQPSIDSITFQGGGYGDVDLLNQFFFPSITNNTSITVVFIKVDDRGRGETDPSKTSFFTGFGRCLIKREPLEELHVSYVNDEKGLYDMFSAFNEFPQHAPLKICIQSSNFCLCNCREFAKLLASKACSVQNLELFGNDSLGFRRMEGGEMDLKDKDIEVLLWKEILKGLKKNTSIHEIELDLIPCYFRILNNNLLSSETAEAAYTSNHFIFDINFTRIKWCDSDLDSSETQSSYGSEFQIDTVHGFVSIDSSNSRSNMDVSNSSLISSGISSNSLDASEGANGYSVEGSDNSEDHMDSVHSFVSDDSRNAQIDLLVDDEQVGNSGSISCRASSNSLEASDDVDGYSVEGSGNCDDHMSSINSLMHADSGIAKIDVFADNEDACNDSSNSCDCLDDRRSIVGSVESEYSQRRGDRACRGNDQVIDDMTLVNRDFDARFIEQRILEDRSLIFQMTSTENRKYKKERNLLLRLKNFNLHNNKTYVACKKVLQGDLLEKAIGRIEDIILVHAVKFFDKALSVGAIQDESMQALEKLNFYYMFVVVLGTKGHLN